MLTIAQEVPPILPDQSGAVWGMVFILLVGVAIPFAVLCLVAYVVSTRQLALEALRRAEIAEMKAERVPASAAHGGREARGGVARLVQ